MTIPGQRTVLIVDDEPAIRDALKRYLKANGYRPVVAADGQEALQRASEQEFEVILLDLKMPGLSGMEVLRQLHTDYPDTSVIIVTAVADVDIAVEAMKSGACDYATKPFNLDDILVRVEKACERRRLVLQVKGFQGNLEEKVMLQTKQLYEATVQAALALIREEILARELDAKLEKEKGLPAWADVKQFAEKVMKHLSQSAS